MDIHCFLLIVVFLFGGGDENSLASLSLFASAVFIYLYPLYHLRLLRLDWFH